MNPNNQTIIDPIKEPVQSSTPIEQPKTKTNWLIPIAFLVLGILIGVGGLWGYQKYFAVKPVATTSPTPVAIADPTANWKTYNDPDNKYSFKYPADLFAKESDEKNFIDIVKNENDPLSNAVISIDARLISPYLNNYEAALKRRISDLGLINTQTVDIPNGVVISGTIAPDMGMAGGLSVTNGLIKYNDGAISVQYNNDNIDQATFYQILSTFKFTGQSTNSSTSVYKYGKFSFTYPNTWTLSENTTNPQFFTQNKLNGFDHTVVLQNGENYLLIGIDTRDTGSTAEGIFVIDTDYQNFLNTRDKILIKGETFYLTKYATTLTDWNRPDREAGIFALASLAKYVPNMTTNDQNQTFNGEKDYFQENGNHYMFIKLSKTGSGLVTTPQNAQSDIKQILESITW